MRTGPLFGNQRKWEILWERHGRSPSHALRKEVMTEQFLPHARRTRRQVVEGCYYSRDRTALERWYARP